MTTTNQPASERPEQPPQTTIQAKPTEGAMSAHVDQQRQLWEAYRLQQQRRHCPGCGETCDAVY